MSTRLINDHPLLIGEILARAEVRRRRRAASVWRRILRRLRSSLRLHPRVAHISPTEIIYNHAPR